MKLDDIFNLNQTMPGIAGTGLIALDIIINDNTKFELKFNAGGSCGNVLTILSYLGWKSYPITHLGSDEATNIIIRDMINWGVDISSIIQSEAGNTPVIIEIIRNNRNNPSHRFLWTCPNCGAKLPRFKALSKRDLARLMNNLPESSVFYFDRATYSSMKIAEAYKEKGSLIFFEPNRIRNQELFSKCIELADIIKFSHDTIGRHKDLFLKTNAPLLIETLGKDGIRFSYHDENRERREWKNMTAFCINKLKDAAGAGDWCSAGIIHLLGRYGARNLSGLDDQDMENAISFGQALAAINCQFEGARGAMYELTPNELLKIANAMNEESFDIEFTVSDCQRTTINSMTNLCPECRRKFDFTNREENRSELMR